jgi:hypothetical protein
VLFEHIRSLDRSKNCGLDKAWEAGRTAQPASPDTTRRHSELLLPVGITALLLQNSIVMLKSRERWGVRLMFYYAFDGVSLGGYDTCLKYLLFLLLSTKATVTYPNNAPSL